MDYPRKHVVVPLLVTVLLGALPGSPAVGQATPEDPLERGRALTEAFYAGEVGQVVEAFDDVMRGATGGEPRVRAFREQVQAEFGDEVAVLSESVTEESGYTAYRRVVNFELLEEPVTVLWVFDSDGRVAGFSIRVEGELLEEAASRYLDYETRTALRLPFDGEWVVVWGGRAVEDNYHAAYTDQRFAYDLAVEIDGERHRGDGAVNEDYFCWGRAVLAPGAGVIVAVRDDLPDNAPGRLNPANPPGNHVVIDHGNGEYSFLAHLQQGSAAVAAGAVVAPGDTLGLCGNSGNSSEPHLHYHLQNAQQFGEGEGMPAQFEDFVADGAVVERGEPVRGQRIRPRDSDG